MLREPTALFGLADRRVDQNGNKTGGLVRATIIHLHSHDGTTALPASQPAMHQRDSNQAGPITPLVPGAYTPDGRKFSVTVDVAMEPDASRSSITAVKH